MDKNFNTTINTATGLWTKNLDDYSKLDEVYLMAKLFSLPTTKSFLTGYPEGLDRMSHRQFYQMQLYGLAVKTGLSTDPLILHQQALTAIGGNITAAQLPFCLWHVWLKYCGLY